MPTAAEKPFAPESIEGATSLDANGVVDLIYTTPQLTIVDTRLHSEYLKGHIEGAIHLIDTDINRTTISRIAPDLHQPLLFYCNGERCLRSSNAVNHALKYGYTNLYWFRGGWQQWLDMELPIAH